MPRNLLIAYCVTWAIHLGYVMVLRSGFAKLLREISSPKIER